MRHLKFILVLVFFFPSCSKRVEDGDWSIPQFSVGEKRHYARCNVFSDETFKGIVWHSSSSKKSKCVFMEIEKSPEALLKNEDLFLQIYPFSVEEGETKYGSSLAIKTIREKEPLISSQIIDAYLVKTELKWEAENFFWDHFFKLCEIEQHWDGLQLVIYERRENQEEPAPIRISKLLLPPFLIHPGRFKEEKGNSLAAFHPFLEFMPKLKSEMSAYNDLAQKMCQPVL